MATLKSMVDLMEQYTKGAGWEWRKCDCIGLLFHCVNYCAPNPQLRADWIPDGLGYHQAIHWLSSKYANPLDPYLAMMSESGLPPSTKPGTASVSLVFGGDDLVAPDGERYPISVVPGIVFGTATAGRYALMLGGLRSVTLTDQPNRTIIRYPLTGII